MKTISVDTRHGRKTIETNLDEAGAIEILRTIGYSSFAADLAACYDRKGSLSERQWPWVFLLAQEELNKKEIERKEMEPLVHDERQMDGVIAMFRMAGEKLQKPVIELVAEDRQVYRLALNPDGSKYPGQVSVSHYGQYLGRITTDGLWLPSVKTEGHPHLVDLLYRFSQEPARVAGEQGRKTGRCCFCRLKLTDERSLAVGYGPICGQRFLPGQWGRIS